MDAGGATVVTGMRLVSYLSPGLPEGLFRALGSLLGDRLGSAVTVSFVHEASGPDPSSPDPLDGADLAFVCAPSYVELRRIGAAALVPAAPVFDDPRNGGRPVYFSDVVVRNDHRAVSLDDLTSVPWAVNDERSLSGYGCVVKALGQDVASVWSGGHLRSMELVRSGLVDAAAIDANALRRADSSGLRVVHTFGPHPVQPLIARPDFAEVEAVAAVLASLSLPGWGVSAFAPVSEEDYPESLE
jgi:phosphonate transport system substrate-binding protein